MTLIIALALAAVLIGVLRISDTVDEHEQIVRDAEYEKY